MKLGLVFAALSLVACAHSVPPAKAPAPKATALDCDKVYNNLINIAVKDNFVSDADGGKLNDLQRMVAVAIVQQTFQESGATERFYNSCLNTANTDQTDCMAKAQTIDAVRLCAKTYETKKNP